MLLARAHTHSQKKNKKVGKKRLRTFSHIIIIQHNNTAYKKENTHMKQPYLFPRLLVLSTPFFSNHCKNKLCIYIYINEAYREKKKEKRIKNTLFFFLFFSLSFPLSDLA